MTDKEFNETAFRKGMKIEVVETGVIYDLVGVDFVDRSFYLNTAMSNEEPLICYAFDCRLINE